MHKLFKTYFTALLTSLILVSGITTNVSADSQPSPVITVTQPQQISISSPIEAIGLLQANQSLDITPQVAGRVVELHLQDGGSVNKDDLLLRLDSREQAALVNKAKISLKDQQRKLANMAELFERNAVSKDELQAQEAEVAILSAALSAEQVKLDYYTVEAPFTGIIGFNNTAIGSLVSNGAVITTLDDISVMKLDIELPEAALSEITPGTTLTAHTKAWPNREFSGQVTAINPRINPQNLTFTARASLDNNDGKLRPGMFMSISVFQPASTVLAIPARSVVFEGNDRYVYVIDDEGIAEKRQIQSDRTINNQVIVTGGLTPDDRIVDEGVVKVTDGRSVSVLQSKIASHQKSLGENRT